MADHAVLARGIHGLEHDEQRALVLRVEQVLEVEQPPLALVERLQRLLLALRAGCRLGVDVGDPEPSARFHAQPVNEAHARVSK